jgi:membrane-associated phospholipid phosphatase
METKMAKSISMSPRQITGDKISKVEASNKSRWLIVWIYFVAAIVALVALSFMVRGAGPLPIDLAASHLIQSYHAGWYDVLLRAVGEPGYPPQVYVLLVWVFLVLFFTRLKWELAMEVFATVGIGVVGLAIKMLVDRARPTADLVNVIVVLDGGKQSFPAGHVQSYMAVFGFLWYVSLVRCKNPWVKSISLVFLGAMIALIGISRVYTGEHWLTGVIGGYLLGSLWLILTIWLYEWGKARLSVKTRLS